MLAVVLVRDGIILDNAEVFKSKDAGEQSDYHGMISPDQQVTLGCVEAAQTK